MWAVVLLTSTSAESRIVTQVQQTPIPGGVIVGNRRLREMTEIVEFEAVSRLETLSTFLLVDRVLVEGVQVSVRLLRRKDRVCQLLVQTGSCVALRSVVAHRLQVFVDEFVVVRHGRIFILRLLYLTKIITDIINEIQKEIPPNIIDKSKII